MKIQNIVLACIFSVLFISCSPKKSRTQNTSIEKEISIPEKVLTKADSLLSETIRAHGGKLYETAHYSFTFRGNRYTFKNNENQYTYTKINKSKNIITKDILQNGKFTRIVANDTLKLTDKAKTTGIGAINSVIYFATLPYKLSDNSVIKTYIGDTKIKGNYYDILGITFQQEGGGKDYDDQFHYWINKKTKKIDYLAYSYHTNGGGIRFRSAYNTRIIDGITFQDYINYKAVIGTPLKELGNLYESNDLEEISRIETENIINLN